MQEIIHAFGIDWRLIVIQVFNFAILAGVLSYFLYTPVLKLLSEREQKIKKGVEDAQKAESALREADVEKSGILKVAHQEAGQIVARATHHATEKSATLLSETEARIARDLRQAQESAEAMKAKILKESEADIARTVILATEKMLETRLSK